MNYQDDIKKSRNQNRSGRETCVCNDKSGIFLTGKHVSWIASAVIVFLFFIFISGYFLGKRKAIEKFYKKVEKESFSDHVYYSMCSMYDKTDAQHGNKESSMNLVAATNGALVDMDEQVSTATMETAELKEKKEVTQKESVESDCQFYAELIGFGTHRAAKKFADKLTQSNVTVAVKKRRSKTARGKVIIWYQVVTEKFSNKNDLIALVDDISVRERLKDVRLVSC